MTASILDFTIEKAVLLGDAEQNQKEWYLRLSNLRLKWTNFRIQYSYFVSNAKQKSIFLFVLRIYSKNCKKYNNVKFYRWLCHIYVMKNHDVIWIFSAWKGNTRQLLFCNMYASRLDKIQKKLFERLVMSFFSIKIF